MSDKTDLVIYINMYVHYPETYNAYTISNKFNSYFNEYFLNNEFTYKQDCDVMLNSIPSMEDETIRINVCIPKKLDVLINIETFTLDCKKFVTEYFNNQIKNIEIEILRVNR